MIEPDARLADVSRHPLARAIAEKRLLVVGFCAAWCNTCEAFEAAFDSLAAARGEAAFIWLDIEDDADVAGDIDVENFPTIAIFERGRPVHFGVSLPQAAIVARLLDALDATTPTIDAAAALADLPARLGATTAARAARALRNP